ncbi:hypothetical protein GCM10017083_14270 [Thalassobaculum fulvum]|jgi:hypothetical protein|uniref:Uncharacterized protein n=1 Tax=Thalassobaculum fulvum TaxID=1633335 RepID=A0A919CNM6_9PROT|nr:hypothetical protein [Thalassobaculum fulvum]GHD45796.1 hypothetical protein GCM10017083_14270 [Thalassobaculum fulvum]
MKAFVSACVAMVVIAVAAWAVLHYAVDGSSQTANTADRGSVRLN